MGALFVRPLTFTTVSANEISTALATNANLDEPARVWRTSNLTTPYCILDMGTSASYDTVSIIGSNLRATDTVQIRTGTTNTGIGNYAGTALAAWSGTLPLNSTAKSVYSLGTTRTERYIRIDFVATSHPDTYVQAQRIVVGKALGLTSGAGVDLGHETSFLDSSIPYVGPGWSGFDEYPVLKQLKLTVSMVTDSDWRTDWYGFLQTVGNKKAFLVVPDDTQPANWQAEAIFGRLTNQATTPQLSWGIRRTDLTITAMAQ